MEDEGACCPFSDSTYSLVPTEENWSLKNIEIVGSGLEIKKKTEKGLIEVVTTGLEIIRLPKCTQNIWLLSLNVSIFAMTFVKYFLYLYHVQNISQKGA